MVFRKRSRSLIDQEPRMQSSVFIVQFRKEMYLVRTSTCFHLRHNIFPWNPECAEFISNLNSDSCCSLPSFFFFNYLVGSTVLGCAISFQRQTKIWTKVIKSKGDFFDLAAIHQAGFFSLSSWVVVAENPLFGRRIPPCTVPFAQG